MSGEEADEILLGANDEYLRDGALEYGDGS